MKMRDLSSLNIDRHIASSSLLRFCLFLAGVSLDNVGRTSRSQLLQSVQSARSAVAVVHVHTLRRFHRLLRAAVRTSRNVKDESTFGRLFQNKALLAVRSKLNNDPARYSSMQTDTNVKAVTACESYARRRTNLIRFPYTEINLFPFPIPSFFQPRTEAFSAVPVGAQAYFNSQAGVGTLAIIPGGIADASSSTPQASHSVGGKGPALGSTRVLRKRGYHTRNRYTRAARENRVHEEKAGRKRARAAVGQEGRDQGDEEDSEDEEAMWKAGGVGGYGGDGGGDSRLEELLRATQVCTFACVPTRTCVFRVLTVRSACLPVPLCL